jgi:hypothetical protein
LRLREWLFAEKIYKEEGEMGEGGEKSWFPGHKLNIIDEFTDKIILSGIPSVILSVKIFTSPYDLTFWIPL